MSQIGNNKTLGSIFKPIITNATYENLKKIDNEDKSINIYNAFIISIPQDDKGEDIKGAGSIWMTDSNGKLYQLTEPINNK